MTEVLISSTVLILILCGIRAFWKGKVNMHLQYALWLLVVIRLFPLGLFTDTFTPKLESPISIMSSFNHFYTSLISTNSNVVTQSEVQANEAKSSNSSEGNSTYTEQSSSRDSTTANKSLLTSNTNENKFNLTLLKTIATTVWYIGMILSTLWILYVNIRFQRTIKKDRKLLNTISCKLPVYVSSSIHSPMLLMINGRFGIYVTKACVDDESKMKHALTHELCHYKHLDYLWSVIRCILLVTYWFNPFVWLAAILSKRDCELSCDAAALKILGDGERIQYGRTILEFVAAHNERSNLLNIATGMSESRSGIKERIKIITKKSKMMLGTCIIILAIVTIAIIATFTTAPKKADGSTHPKETALIANEQSPSTSEEASNDLSSLLDNNAQTQGFDADYYFNGTQFITPDGPIESLSDFTDEIVVNKYYGRNIWGEVDNVLDNGYSKSFSKLEGVSYWLTIDTSKEATITIDYSTTASDTSLKTLIILPHKSTIELKNGESNTVTLPQGETEIAIVAFGAAGEVNINFNDLSDGVRIQKTN